MLKKEECCTEFTKVLRQALGGREELLHDWETTHVVLKETAKKGLVVSSGQKKEHKEIL